MRVLGMPYNKTDADADVACPPMSLQSAIEELTNYTNSKLDSVSTVSMLATTKLPKIQWTTSDYEWNNVRSFFRMLRSSLLFFRDKGSRYTVEALIRCCWR